MHESAQSRIRERYDCKHKLFHKLMVLMHDSEANRDDLLGVLAAIKIEQQDILFELSLMKKEMQS